MTLLAAHCGPPVPIKRHMLDSGIVRPYQETPHTRIRGLPHDGVR